MTVKIELTEGDKTIVLQISGTEISQAKDAALLISTKVKYAIAMLGAK